jgi:hypothetical protein
MLAYNELRRFLARMLGWTCGHAIDHALRSIELAAYYRAALVLCGAGDLVPIALSLHRRTLGADRPFIVCDPHRANASASVRSPGNYKSGARAVSEALGGSLCVRAHRLPSDFASMAERLRGAEEVRLVVCTDTRDEVHPLLVRPEPIVVPPLAMRTNELPRIVDEYAAEAIDELGAPRNGFTDADRAWVCDHASTSITEIEKATLRIVALRASRNTSGAAARLGMAPVSLSRWVGRRRLPSSSTQDRIEPCSPIESTTALATRGNPGSRR